MSIHFFKYAEALKRLLAGTIIALMILALVPAEVYAESASSTDPVAEEVPVEEPLAEEPPAEEPVVEEAATSSGETVLPDEETATSTDETVEATASSTEPTAEVATSTATSTNDGTDGAAGEDTSSATTTDDGTATSTNNGTAPTEGADGSEGVEGGTGAEGTGVEPEDEGEPIPVVSEIDIGNDPTPNDGEGITGEVIKTGRNTTITTGAATAQGEVSTDVNSNLVRSEIAGAAPADLDTYTFTATGTNDAVVTTDGVTFALTGENKAYATNVSDVKTGDATAALNIANVVNSNVINSDGFLYLKNQKLAAGQSLDLTDFFFPDPAETRSLSGDCTLLSCRAEDVVFNFSEFNQATITNDAIIRANSGDNLATGDYAQITTGNAYGGANVINVVNTNIVDSNYRLLTYNAMGDLDGDLILPTEELFYDFFSRPNGISQTTYREGPDAININVDNTNEAQVDNNVDAVADSGANIATTDFDSDIITGMAESESNILNKVNQNVYGGDSMYLLIRVHGYWSGDVKGLPAGLTWAWTPDGILIYNEGAEIAPSPILPNDMDSYTANFTDRNDVVIANNVNIESITGRNDVDGVYGVIKTGNAIASANVMNVANTNIVGTNWTYAVINIFGDFDGDVTFSATDVSVVGAVASPDDPLQPGSDLTYTYTVKNESDKTATGVVLRQTLQTAYATGSNNQQTHNVGTLTPGQSKVVTLTAKVANLTNYGNYTVIATAVIESNEADNNTANNSSLLKNTFAYVDPGAAGGGGAGAGGGSSSTTGSTTASTTDETGTSTDATGTSTDEVNEQTDATDTPVLNTNSPSSGGGGGGGGGGSKNKSTTKKVERAEIVVDPNAPPFLVVDKFANFDEDDEVIAGEAVDYTIVVTNKGGQAYDAVVYDTLTNPSGSVVNEDSWELGTIAAGEVIKLTYTTEYDFKTPSGEYTNVASMKAYRTAEGKENGADPLKIDDAEYVVTIKGVPLAVGNVAVLAVFPGANGTVSALVSWETSKVANSQVFYGQKFPWSTFSENLPNLGYQQASFKFSTPKNRHLMIINGLKPGLEYAYRMDADNGEFDAISREYTFKVPAVVNSLALNTGKGFLSMNDILGRVAGVQTTAPRPYTPPAPAPAPEPVAKPDPEPEPEPEPATTANVGGGGFFGKVKDSFVGLFR